MEVSNVLWILFLLMAVQPLVSRQILKTMRSQRLARIQRSRNSRVIAIIHRQEAMRLFGFPIARYIDIEDAEEVLRAIRETDPQTPIDVILHTPGGIALAALQIGHALRAHPGRVTIFVPHFAMSGGTLVALAADEIVMSDHAVLGPVDPQVNGMPAASIIKAASEKPIGRVEDETLIYADVARKAIEQLHIGACELLSRRLSENDAKALAEQLTSGRWTHDYPITARQAAELGLNVRTQMPEEMFELLTLYPKPAGQRTSVESGPELARRDRK